MKIVQYLDNYAISKQTVERNAQVFATDISKKSRTIDKRSATQEISGSLWMQNGRNGWRVSHQNRWISNARPGSVRASSSRSLRKGESQIGGAESTGHYRTCHNTNMVDKLHGWSSQELQVANLPWSSTAEQSYSMTTLSSTDYRRCLNEVAVHGSVHQVGSQEQFLARWIGWRIIIPDNNQLTILGRYRWKRMPLDISSASMTSWDVSWRSTPSIWENQEAASLDARLHSVNFERQHALTQYVSLRTRFFSFLVTSADTFSSELLIF